MNDIELEEKIIDILLKLPISACQGSACSPPDVYTLNLKSLYAMRNSIEGNKESWKKARSVFHKNINEVGKRGVK